MRSGVHASLRAGIAVSIPGRHEGVERIARVLSTAGLATAVYVPADLSGVARAASRLGPKSAAASWLAKWAYEPPARSAALPQELLLTAALRTAWLARSRGVRITRWRNAAVDWRAAEDIRSGR